MLVFNKHIVVVVQRGDTIRF